jgi:hypothetical protein
MLLLESFIIVLHLVKKATPEGMTDYFDSYF